MKKTLSISLSIAVTIALSSLNSAKAADTANVKVNATLPVLNDVSTTGGNLSTDISVDNGQLSSNLTPTFQASTNNSNGVLVQFTVQAPSSSGDVTGTKGTNNNNTGRLVLANSTIKPTGTAVSKALQGSQGASSNINAIAYKVTLTGDQNGNTYNPVFDNTGSTASVTAPSGTTDFTVQIGNDSGMLQDTYSSDTDLAGAYEATIYCTVSNP